MSKESKPRDRWRQLHAAAASRPGEYCPGCGYYLVAMGDHRTDCTRHRTVKPKEDTCP